MQSHTESVRRKMAQPGFEEELIREVRERPTIWNRKNKNYNNRMMHDQEWSQVATKLDCPKDALKSKWRNMRDVFMKEFKKETSKWVHYQHLLFLKEASHCNSTVKEEPPDDDDRRDEQTSNASTAGSHFMDSLVAPSPEILARWNGPTILPVTSSDPMTTERSNRKRHRAPTPEYQRQIDRYEEAEEVRIETDDDDMLFLRSLAPFLKHLPPVQKLRLRSKIENLIADELCNSCTAT